MVTIVVGGQWGDEGKGKIVSYLALKDKFDIIVRAGVGPNAGHTVIYNGKKYGLRHIPSGFVYEKAMLYIGAGVLINPEVFLKEVEETNTKNRIKIDYRCGIIEKIHIQMDTSDSYLKKTIGSTGTGCGPANVDRVRRKLKLARDIDILKDFLTDVPLELNRAMKNGKKILIEGTQGFGLSLYYGTYPYVTSKDTTASTFCADVGIGPKHVKDVIVVFKSFPTRVGQGPFPTEISKEEAERLGIVEYGTVTGRRRRVGLFDFEIAKYACMINSATQVAITCVDYIDKRAYKVRSYEKLPDSVKRFIERVEKELDIPVTLISTGPEIYDTIDLRELKL